MPSRYYKILVPVLLFFAAIGIAAGVGYKSVNDHAAPVTPVATSTASTTPDAIVPATSTSTVVSSVTTTTKVSTASSTQSTSTVTFIVGDAHYSVVITSGETVENAMKTLAAQKTGFVYTEKSYTGLGEYINSINGEPNGNGLYWFLYVNGKSSDTGASATHLSPGDTVTWKYEQNY